MKSGATLLKISERTTTKGMNDVTNPPLGHTGFLQLWVH